VGLAASIDAPPVGSVQASLWIDAIDFLFQHRPVPSIDALDFLCSWPWFEKVESHSAAGERLMSCHLHYIMYVFHTNKRLYIATSFPSVFVDVSGQSRRLGALKVATLQRKKWSIYAIQCHKLLRLV
jgi:hypothetical protein